MRGRPKQGQRRDALPCDPSLCSFLDQRLIVRMESAMVSCKKVVPLILGDGCEEVVPSLREKMGGSVLVEPAEFTVKVVGRREEKLTRPSLDSRFVVLTSV